MDNAQSYVETRAQSLDGSIGFLPLFRRDTVWMIEKVEPRVQVKWNQA